MPSYAKRCYHGLLSGELRAAKPMLRSLPEQDTNTMSMEMDPNAMVRALEKLLDYTASGIGAVAGPMLAPWKARREAAALQIAAQGEANALRIIADAQAEAREALVSTASDVRGEIDIAETVRQKILFQEDKRHRNTGSVVRQTAAVRFTGRAAGKQGGSRVSRPVVRFRHMERAVYQPSTPGARRVHPRAAFPTTATQRLSHCVAGVDRRDVRTDHQPHGRPREHASHVDQ